MSDHAVRPDEATSPAERWLGEHRRAVLLGLLAGAVLVRLLVALQLAGGPLPRLHALWPDTDNHFFDRWGQRIAEGEVLQPEPWHPLTPWMIRAARPSSGPNAAPGADAGAGARWDRLLGGATFYQEPAYPYLIGLTYRLAGPAAWAVYGWQLALGALGVLLVHELARRLSSRRAALAAGVLALLAPVPLYLELTLLRDALVAYVTLALALLMLWAAEGGRRRWFVLGLAFGGAALLKQTFLAFPVLMGAWRLLAVRSSPRARWSAAGAVLAGMGVALLPCVARNLAVGAPALALNGSAAAMLPVYHTVSATPFTIHFGDDFFQVLGAPGGALRALARALSTHPTVWSALGLELGKLGCAWHGYEAPNNVDFYLFARASPALGLLPARLPLLVPPAAVGLLAARGRAWSLLVAGAATLAGVVAAAAFSRYRAPLVPLLLPAAGAGLVTCAAWVRAGRWRPLAAAALLSAAYLAWAAAGPPGVDRLARAYAYRLGSDHFAEQAPDLAVLYLEEAMRLVPGQPRAELRMARLLLRAGRAGAALPHAESAARSLGSSEARALLARALVALGRGGEAANGLRTAVQGGWAGPEERALLEQLEPPGPGRRDQAEVGPGGEP